MFTDKKRVIFLIERLAVRKLGVTSHHKDNTKSPISGNDSSKPHIAHLRDNFLYCILSKISVSHPCLAIWYSLLLSGCTTSMKTMKPHNKATSMAMCIGTAV